MLISGLSFHWSANLQGAVPHLEVMGLLFQFTLPLVIPQWIGGGVPVSTSETKSRRRSNGK